MFRLTVNNWSFDAGLQIVQADIRLEAGGELLVDEPLCVDVGLPALLESALRDTSPDRWAPVHEWQRMPFFVCGCGDPECRGFSFAAVHDSAGYVRLTEVEERQGSANRELGVYEISAPAYQQQVLAVGEAFLTFVEPRDYRPYYADTVTVVQRLVAELRAAASGGR